MASKKTQRKQKKNIDGESTKETTSFADDWKKLKEDTIKDITGLVSAHESLCKKDATGLHHQINSLVAERDKILERESVALTELKESRKKIKELEDERKGLKNEIENLNDNVINNLITERDKTLEKEMAYSTELKESRRKIKDLEDERKSLKNEIEDLDNSLAAEREKALEQKKANMVELEESRKKVTQLELELSHKMKDKLIEEIDNNIKLSKENHDRNLKSDAPATSCDSGIHMDFNLLKEQLEIQIDSMIDDKINAKLGSELCLKETNDNMCDSDERVHLAKQDVISSEREENLIIHGLTEIEGEKADENKVRDIFARMKVIFKPLTIFRLGPKRDNRVRPLMVKMKSIAEKNSIMAQLWKLKWATKEKVSITHDYTLDERRSIKEMVDEAKKRNENDRKNGKKTIMYGS